MDGDIIKCDRDLKPNNWVRKDQKDLIPQTVKPQLLFLRTGEESLPPLPLLTGLYGLEDSSCPGLPPTLKYEAPVATGNL